MRLSAALVVLLVLLTPALGREEIRSFATAITLKADGSVDVTETIEVNAEGDQIRRGIFRTIFTTLTNPDRSRLRSSFHVVSVLRTGRPEPFARDNSADRVNLRIGDADVFLNSGVHRYTIRYTMTRMGRFFDDHDELFWNATGNYWDFPINRATATVRLPDGAVISKLVAYTGPPGSEAQAATATRNSDTIASFATTRVLQPGEGLSVAVAFPKGILVEPTGNQALIYWLSDHRDLLLPAFAVLIVLLYNYFAWDAVGRDPRKGTIIPLFHPPKGFSPALVHFIHRMGWKNSGWTAFTATIFDLGVKGLLHISQAGKTLTVTATGKAPADKLPSGESLLFNYFSSKGKLTINTSTGADIAKKRTEMMAAVQSENRQVYFNNNTGHVIAGAALSLALLGALVFFGVLDLIWLIVAVVGGVFVGLFTSAFQQVWSGPRFSPFVIFVWVIIAAGNLFGGFTSWLNSGGLNTAVLAAVSIVIIDVVFAILLRAPTAQGRRIMDQIEGFRMYLETAEKERLNMRGEPQMTVTRFESILPYAIALGVEKPWSQHFESELARNAVPDATGSTYRPGWYSGRDFSGSSGGFSNAVTAASSGMSAAMMSAQPASSSSSGFSSGGGGSGGGGGGGGGGGW